jgi:hypothetical protein
MARLPPPYLITSLGEGTVWLLTFNFIHFMAAFWAVHVFTFEGSGPALTAHGSMDLKEKQEIQLQFRLAFLLDVCAIVLFMLVIVKMLQDYVAWCSKTGCKM